MYQCRTNVIRNLNCLIFVNKFKKPYVIICTNQFQLTVGNYLN